MCLWHLCCSCWCCSCHCSSVILSLLFVPVCQVTLTAKESLLQFILMVHYCIMLHIPIPHSVLLFSSIPSSSERPAGYYPPPPPGIAPRPVPVSPKSIDTSSLPKPTPPPAASAPPPSPTRMPKDGVDAGRTPPSPGGATAKLSTRQGDCEKCKQPIRYSAVPTHWTP